LGGTRYVCNPYGSGQCHSIIDGWSMSFAAEHEDKQWQDSERELELA
jgi:hypothetical protein